MGGEVFKDYAASYDGFYLDKNYDAECDFIEEVIKRHFEGDRTNTLSLLDLGCGTGGHSIPLAKKNYNVIGVDRSASMIEIAREKNKTLDIENTPKFLIGDIQNINFEQQFDVIICMFAVLSYQVTNEELVSTINSVRSNLKPGGLFICDFWYGPGVLADPPQQRIKTVATQSEKTIRIATPTMNCRDNTVCVEYQVLKIANGKVLGDYKENHTMRYFFEPELKLILSESGLEPVLFCPFCNLDGEIEAGCWNLSLISRGK